MSDIDKHTEHHRQQAAWKQAAQLLGPIDSAHAAVLAVDLERLTAAEQARTDLTPKARAFWDAIATIASTGIGDLPELPDPGPRLAERRPLPKGLGLMCSEERAELEVVATEVPYLERNTVVAHLELEQASEGELTLLDDGQRAAARLLQDDKRRRTALADIGRELKTSRNRLDAMNPARPTDLSTPSVTLFGF